MKSAALLLVFLFFATSAAAMDGTGCETLLSQRDLVQALYKAAKLDYKFEILKKRVDGKDRVVVLLGEVHRKTRESEKAGSEVIQHFEDVGIEGFKRGNSWGERFWAFLVKMRIVPKKSVNQNPQGLDTGAPLPSLRRFFWVKEKPELRVNGKVVDPKTMTETSSIYFAYAMNDVHNTLKVLTEQPREKLVALDERLSKIPVTKSNVSIQLLPGMSVAPIRVLKKMVKDVLDGKYQELPNPRKIYHLEKDYVPGLARQLNSIEREIILGGFLASFAAFAVTRNPDVMGVMQLAMIPLWTYFSAGLREVVKNSRNSDINESDSKRVQRLFPTSFSILVDRDRGMVENIGKILESNAQVERLLAIVGMGHVPGMRERLLKQGYEIVTLPAEEKSSSP